MVPSTRLAAVLLRIAAALHQPAAQENEKRNLEVHLGGSHLLAAPLFAVLKTQAVITTN